MPATKIPRYIKFLYFRGKMCIRDSPIRVKIKENAPNDLNIKININYRAKNGLDEKDGTVYTQLEDTAYTLSLIHISRK